jgi:hypothetical protein
VTYQPILLTRKLGMECIRVAIELTADKILSISKSS